MRNKWKLTKHADKFSIWWWDYPMNNDFKFWKVPKKKTTNFRFCFQNLVWNNVEKEGNWKKQEFSSAWRLKLCFHLLNYILTDFTSIKISKTRRVNSKEVCEIKIHGYNSYHFLLWYNGYTTQIHKKQFYSEPEKLQSLLQRLFSHLSLLPRIIREFLMKSNWIASSWPRIISILNFCSGINAH